MRTLQKKAWQAFRDDPDWQKAKADSEKDGVPVKKVDSTNLKATDYSPLREPPGPLPGKKQTRPGHFASGLSDS